MMGQIKQSQESVTLIKQYSKQSLLPSDEDNKNCEWEI